MDIKWDMVKWHFLEDAKGFIWKFAFGSLRKGCTDENVIEATDEEHYQMLAAMILVAADRSYEDVEQFLLEMTNFLPLYRARKAIERVNDKIVEASWFKEQLKELGL